MGNRYDPRRPQGVPVTPRRRPSPRRAPNGTPGRALGPMSGRAPNQQGDPVAAAQRLGIQLGQMYGQRMMAQRKQQEQARRENLLQTAARGEGGAREGSMRKALEILMNRMGAQGRPTPGQRRRRNPAQTTRPYKRRTL